MEISVRLATEADYREAVRIMDQVQMLHVEWRPDIYKPTENLLPEEFYRQMIAIEAMYVAETDVNCGSEAGNRIIGVMAVQFRHIENPANVTRDIVFVDSMAVDENYRGKGVGHCFFDRLRELKKEKKLDGIELQVNARNKAAYKMYSDYGFTEKSINMELLE